ncbi:hypothetical protein GcM3_185034 [Golovinomyces cichoracearum]|uniref:CCHC-type domain-containing protein n=1 Tax=Golovinomyces cichoracearum TaxID=62708 RepID=A0A420HK77_9PEZI|nr:hypothetical protein GcM3_185034 [Golovinomyces cichoracearum]
MVNFADIDMTEENQYYRAPEAQASTDPSDLDPSWVSHLVRILTQLIRSHPTPKNTIVSDHRPAHSQPHPEKFSGLDPKSFPQFRSLLEAKLRIDSRAIGSEEERVWYGFGRLSDIASRRIYPWIETFLQDFEQTISEAQGWGWEDRIKKAYLRTALNRELSDRLVSQDEPSGYDDFVAQLHRTSDKLEVIKGWNQRRNRNQGMPINLQQIPNTEPIGDQMEWEPTQSINFASAQHNLVGRVHQSSNRTVWVLQAEIVRRISEGLCIRCGRQGDRIRDCTLLPALNPSRMTKNYPPKSNLSAVEIPTEPRVENISGNA